MSPISSGLALLALAADLIAGRLIDPIEISRRLAGLALDLVPVDLLREHLTETARARADTIADAVEGAKFGSEP